MHTNKVLNESMPTDVQIIRSRAELLQSQHACFASVVAEREYLAFLEPPSLDDVIAFNRAQNERGMIAFQAVLGDRVVGWCDVRPALVEGFSHNGDLGMGIHAYFRSQGIGTRLIAATIDACWSSGLKRISLEVFSSNLPAIRLYEKVGFQTEVVKSRGRLLDGRYDNVHTMGLLHDG
ncbi:MAG: GNAT family N-acetyltransferase [Chloroflexi bacterium]|nr:GNAT family N-acetyltransferase [Chloroflexota bacterium]